MLVESLNKFGLGVRKDGSIHDLSDLSHIAPDGFDPNELVSEIDWPA